MIDLKDLLVDIQWRIERLEVIAAQGYDSLLTDVDRQASVERYLEIIGEIVRKLPESMKTKYPSISWSDIVGLRNILAHDYHRIDIGIMWATITKSIPELKQVIKSALASLSEDDLSEEIDRSQ